MMLCMCSMLTPDPGKSACMSCWSSHYVEQLVMGAAAHAACAEGDVERLCSAA